MAKFEDYAKQTDELDNEIEQAGTESSERKAEVPERFKDKSAEEIAASYVELEKKFSQQGNDLGTMRSQIDQLVRQSEEQSQAAAEQAEEPDPVDIDALYEDPEAAIERVIEKKLRPQLEAQAQQLAAQDTEKQLAAMDDKYDGWRETVTTPEFQEWTQKSQYRQRMAAGVRERGDIDAANDLLEQYYDTQVKQASAEKKEAVARNLKDAQMETGSASFAEPKETYSRVDLLDRRIAAKRGDQKAQRWLQANQGNIQAAYEEGRITD